MPAPSKTGRSLTKQPVRPARYFPGKQIGEDAVSDDDDDDESEQDGDEPQEAAPKAPAPTFSSFKKPAFDVKPAAPVPKAPESKPPDLEGFETASESSEDEEDGSGSEAEGESSEEEDSSSDDEPKRPMLAPKFVSKSKRAQQPTPTASDPQKGEEAERKRKERADELLQAQIEREQAARAAGKKFWDDDDDAVDEVDDRDGIDREAERAAWTLRELKRVQRDRQRLVAKEQEREEVERRRNMTAEEREKEDREFLEKQHEEQENKGRMKYMQKYFHKGAFFGADGEEMDEEVRAALRRDVAGRKFVDEAGDKSVLPEYMKIRDATKLGKKGRTRYKDLKSEDTGSWGRFEGKTRDVHAVDDRFRPDERLGGAERTGANSAPVGDRRRRYDDDGRAEKRPKIG